MTERPGGYALNAPQAAPSAGSPTAPGAGVRGRGARSNASGRYEAFAREAFDDGWTEADAPAPRLGTTILKDASRSIVATNSSPDISFDQSINPYRGCEHGCIYCYARPSHAYWGYSPGLDFESVIFAKPDGPALLEAFFNRPGYQPKPIVIGANTDAWQPVERRLQHTREILKVFARYRHPVSFITKSALVLRDLDILGPMAADGLAKGAISVTTLDRRLARDMEPRAAAPHRRLEAVRGLSEAGLPVTLMMAPIIPALNDNEIEAVFKAGAEAGAVNASYVLLRLPLEIKDLFREWLQTARPDAAGRVMSLIRQMRGGRDYDPQWGTRGRGQGPLAELIVNRVRAAIRRYGLTAPRTELDFSKFERPLGSAGQPSLF
ncbi:PA0069 family radical SAM protein [Maricaulis sp.]|uniref:PA0069 family radical SAM protein n=1 Tax=Maricaulis sp. TaxID=1486257 RepID=UPI0032980AD0